MAAFGLGTLPALLAAGLWVGRFDAVVRRRGARLAAGLAVAAFGVHALVSLALSIGGGGDPHAHHHHVGVIERPAPTGFDPRRLNGG
jgi:sulfite exporter TauE/SafE